MPNTKGELLEINKQEKLIKIVPEELVKSTRPRDRQQIEWLGKAKVIGSCLSAALLLGSLKRGRLGAIYSKIPTISTYHMSRYPFSATRLTSARSQWNKFGEKATESVNRSKPLLKTAKKDAVKSYNFPKSNSSYSITKFSKKTPPLSRPYTTWKSLKLNTISQKKMSPTMWGMGGSILGATSLTAYFTSGGRFFNNNQLTTDALKKDNSINDAINSEDSQQKIPKNSSGGEGYNRRRQLLTDYRPSDGDHLHYAVQAYEDTGGEVLKNQGWELIRTSGPNAADSYFGAAYCNTDKRHIIIAHRGTQDKRDWLTNFDLINRHLNEQEASAWNFSKEIIEKHGPTYSYSFTGHSLGGWLALISLYKYKDELVNGKADPYQDGFAVTFDNPGGEQLLEALQPRVSKDYRIDVSRLDITSYLSYPNLVNTTMGHVGSVYASFPKMDLSWIQKNTLLFTIKTHDKQLFLNSFSKNTGLPEKCFYVLDWPRVQWVEPSPSSNSPKGWLGYLASMLVAYGRGEIQRGEYLGFYTYDLDKANNPALLPSVSQFELKHGIHYRVQEFDEQKLPLRNMPQVVRFFLEELSNYPNRIEVINRIKAMKQVDVDPIDQQLASLLQSYAINEQKELAIHKGSTNKTARAFRDKILKFLKANDFLYKNNLSVLYTESIAQEATEERIFSGLHTQLQHTRNLIDRLSFQQGTPRLYKLIKPSWEDIDDIRRERNTFDTQLESLELHKLRIGGILSISEEKRDKLIEKLQLQEQQLKFGKQISDTLLMYMEEDLTGADSQLGCLVDTLNKKGFNLPGLDNKVLLNRAYNLKAKIAARQGKYELSEGHYEKATQLLPKDAITWSNYGGLLTDRGRSERNPNLYIQAYKCYDKLYMDQINPQQLPVVCSGKAYAFIMLAQSIEEKKIDRIQAELPSVTELRSQALVLLKRAIEADPNYLNARLFSAILFYDQKDYNRALQEVSNVLTINDTHSTALMRKGFIMDKLGKRDEAIELLQRARRKLQGTSWAKEIDEKISEIKQRK